MRLYDYDASGNCFKVRLLLALLGSDYERVPVDIFAGDTLTPEFARLNPVRETPVLALGKTALETLEGRLSARRFLVGDGCSIADISTYAYTHVAPDAGYDLADYPAVARWLQLVEAEPGFVNDLVPYPDNARASNSSSIYDG
jgi:glutathione S-transferase